MRYINPSVEIVSRAGKGAKRRKMDRIKQFWVSITEEEKAILASIIEMDAANLSNPRRRNDLMIAAEKAAKEFTTTCNIKIDMYPDGVNIRVYGGIGPWTIDPDPDDEEGYVVTLMRREWDYYHHK